MKKILGLPLLLAAFAPKAFAQAGYTVAAVPGGSLYVCKYNGPPMPAFPCPILASIYTTSALTTPISQPASLTSAVTFYALYGQYVVQIGVSGSLSQQYILALPAPPSTGNGAVSSVFTRTGAVTAQSGDYTCAQVTNCAQLSGQTAGSLPLASSATASTSSSLFTDNGTTGAYTGTGGFTAPSLTASGSTAGYFQCAQGSANGHATANTITDECPASVTAYEFVRPGAAATGIPHWSNSAGVVTASISLIAAADMNAQYSKGSCTEVWGGSGTSFAMQAGDDVISNNSCYNDSGVTRTITALKCRSDNAANTTVLTPTFGSAGTGTAILTGTVTCGNSYAYSATGTLNNTAWTTGTGIDPGMSTVGNATSIAMIVEYTY